MNEWKRLTELSDCYRAGGGEVTEMIELFEAKIQTVRNWVDDLQSGMYINCVYCGHRYGPHKYTPVAMADGFREHIEQCPEHPLSKAKNEIERLQAIGDKQSRELREAKIGEQHWRDEATTEMEVDKSYEVAFHNVAIHAGLDIGNGRCRLEEELSDIASAYRAAAEAAEEK